MTELSLVPPDEVPNPNTPPKTLIELRNEMLQIGGSLSIYESNVIWLDGQLSDIMTQLNHTRGEINHLRVAFEAALDAYSAAKAAGLK